MARPCDCSPPRELVLCFDGTGNTFRADGGESNILKIFRMLDRNKENRAGIGTEMTPGSFANAAFRPFSNLPTHKIFDQALASSFDQHVIGGYRFLARRWVVGSRIYLFGFSRGAYTARFLNEMLDFVGLISGDNEELISFVWEAFIRWKFAPPGKERDKAKCDLEISRTTMCRSVGYVHFLGLFDTVNSVFKQPYDGYDNDVDGVIQPNPITMRHAVSIDERRIKFQPVLFSRGSRTQAKRVSTWAGHYDPILRASVCNDEIADHPADLGGAAHPPPPPRLNDNFEEVFFAGDHSDVGGGWPLANGHKYTASQIPLMWMVQEAQFAGLTFDPIQLQRLGCFDPRHGAKFANGERFDPEVVQAAERAPLHDSLQYETGKIVETFFWRVLECLPYKRPKVAPDGTVQMSRWHGWGLRRPLPPGAKVHSSVLNRLRSDPTYRPYNLGLGHKPKETELGEEEREIGKWRHVEHKGLCDFYVKVKEEKTNAQMSGMIDDSSSQER